MDTRLSPEPLVVLKFGSSLLSEARGFEVSADVVAGHVRRGKRVVAVCSARRGVTDDLLAFAGQVAPRPDARLVARLVATGEGASVALLALALEARCVATAVLDGEGLGIRTRGDLLDAEPVDVDGTRLLGLLTATRVLVVPGFVGVDGSGSPSLLGRGGSDLTALFLAHRLGAAECHLVKDVDGLYPVDPKTRPGVRPLLRATWEEVSDLGAGVVQEKALRYASLHGRGFRITAPHGTGTWVGPALQVAS